LKVKVLVKVLVRLRKLEARMQRGKVRALAARQLLVKTNPLSPSVNVVYFCSPSFKTQ